LATRIQRKASGELIPTERIEGRILLVRGHKVILDSDLAELYGVSTKRLNEQVKRNLDRFPEDFCFQLSPEETTLLRSQIATSRWGGRRYPPYAFTEHGAIMAANLINSPIAVKTSVLVVRAFVRLREILGTHKDLARKLEQLEKKYDAQFRVVFDAIRELMSPPDEPRKGKIGYLAEGK
jgi:hypothetical protein